MTVKSSPGTSVERKQAATDWLVTKAYIIMVMLGGIRVLRTAEALMIAAEYPLGYPCFSISGIIMVPMAITDEAAAPEIAPKTAEVTHATIPSPPGILPAMAFARSSRRRAMLPPVTTYPNAMKKGMLKRVTEFRLVKPTGRRKPGSIPLVMVRKMMETRNPKGMGTPENIRQAKMRRELAIIQSMSQSPLSAKAYAEALHGQ